MSLTVYINSFFEIIERKPEAIQLMLTLRWKFVSAALA
jgi:hypothetical protein